MNEIKEFIIAALPLLMIGVSMAIFAVDCVAKDKNNKKPDSRMAEGMCLGMGVGIVLGTTILPLAIGTCSGLLLGTVLGCCIKEKRVS